MPRHQHQFDWDEAKRMYAGGMSIIEISRQLGVSDSGIRRVVVPGVRELYNSRASEWQRHGNCLDCGARVSRRPKGKEARCVRCANIRRGTTARAGELQCCTCRQWKPDDGFHRNASEKYARRGRHKECRVCNTISKRKWRERQEV